MKRDTVMSYKRIPSAIHNFAHSFVSLMNYVDDEYIVDVLPGILIAIPDHQLKIQFPDGQLVPTGTYPENLLKSVAYYAQCYKDHMVSEGIDPAKLRKAEFVIYGDLYGMHCRAEAEDDRGKHYENQVLGLRGQSDLITLLFRQGQLAAERRENGGEGSLQPSDQLR